MENAMSEPVSEPQIDPATAKGRAFVQRFKAAQQHIADDCVAVFDQVVSEADTAMLFQTFAKVAGNGFGTEIQREREHSFGNYFDARENGWPLASGRCVFKLMASGVSEEMRFSVYLRKNGSYEVGEMNITGKAGIIFWGLDRKPSNLREAFGLVGAWIDKLDETYPYFNIRQQMAAAKEEILRERAAAAQAQVEEPQKFWCV
jgi:hypothetical protein